MTLSLYAGDDFSFPLELDTTDRDESAHLDAGLRCVVISSEHTGAVELADELVTMSPAAGDVITGRLRVGKLVTSTWPAGDHTLYVQTLAADDSKVEQRHTLRVHLPPAGDVPELTELAARCQLAEAERDALLQALEELNGSIPD
jgi:hypothetical protein